MLERLREANEERQREWDPKNEIDVAYRAVELGGEVGEVLNVVKKIRRERIGLPGSRVTIDDLADELADVIICTDLLAMSFGIDLAEAVAKKFNKTSEKVGLKTRMNQCIS